MASAGAAALGLAVGPGSAGAAPDGPSRLDVRVVNTAAEPVPVSGNVNVAGTVGLSGPATVQGTVGLAPGTGVAATQAGPWSVGVSNLPAVQIDPAHNGVQVNGLPAVQIDPAANGVRVANDAANPVPVSVQDGRKGFQRYFIMSIQGGQRCQTAGIELVPDGTRLVITSINTHMYPITGVSVRTWVQAHRADASFANIHVPYEKQDYHDDVNDRDDYVGHVETTLVHENSYPFFVTICMSQVAPGGPLNGLGVFQGSVVGYTEPLAG